MKKIAILLLVLLVAFCTFWFLFRSKNNENKVAKLTPIALKTHSVAFNSSVDKLMTAYFDLKNAFVEDDTVKVKLNAMSFISFLDSIPLVELKKDTSSIFETAQSNMNDIRANAQSLLKQTTITEMRRDFSMVTEMLYPSFFKAINYEGGGLYLQNCPMAFGDDQPANWISNSSEVVNPYLGKNHPEFKATMLHCGSVKDSIVAK